MSEALPLAQNINLSIGSISTDTTFSINVGGSDEIKIDATTSPTQITIGSSESKIILDGGQCVKITELTGTSASYDVLETDYIVHIVSNTYTSINLPPATDCKGRVITVVRKFAGPVGSYFVYADGSDTIDGVSSIKLAKKDDLVNLTSNGVDEWNIT